MNKERDVQLLDYMKVLLQYCLPQHHLTGCIYKLTRIKQACFKNVLIRLFIRLFKVDMNSSTKQQPEDFQHFNEFFTRELKKETRPIAKSQIISPVDGYLSQFTSIKKQTLIQAKGHDYTLKDLLAHDLEAVNQFEDGEFSTLYLSPKNYHRIHMPVHGRLLKMVFVPGKLFAVNQHTTKTVPNLFARNERVIIHFETEFGPMILIMVGAIFVGSMETVWYGQITPSKIRTIRKWDYQNDDLEFIQGDEIGRFNMGSTVILLFPKETIEWDKTLVQNQEVIMGQGLSNH